MRKGPLPDHRYRKPTLSQALRWWPTPKMRAPLAVWAARDDVKKVVKLLGPSRHCENLTLEHLDRAAATMLCRGEERVAVERKMALFVKLLRHAKPTGWFIIEPHWDWPAERERQRAARLAARHTSILAAFRELDDCATRAFDGER